MHRVGDLDVRIEEARYIAARIPGARLVELPGERSSALDRGLRCSRRGDRRIRDGCAPATRCRPVLATVLFTDIVESTGHTVLARRSLVARSGRTTSRHRARRDCTLARPRAEHCRRWLLRDVRRARACDPLRLRSARSGSRARRRDPRRPAHRRVDVVGRGQRFRGADRRPCAAMSERGQMLVSRRSRTLSPVAVSPSSRRASTSSRVCPSAGGSTAWSIRRRRASRTRRSSSPCSPARARHRRRVSSSPRRPSYTRGRCRRRSRSVRPG